MASRSNFPSRSDEEKDLNQTYMDGNLNENLTQDSSGVRARNINPVAGKQYGNAIGRLREKDDEDSTASGTTEDHYQRTTHRRRERVRKRLREKQKVPGHVQWVKWMNSEWKNYTVAMIGEFVGTTLFLFFALGGTQVANIGDGSTANNTTTGSNTGGVDPSKLLYISLSFGFSLMVNAWIFFRISGGLFNPAVTLALTLTRDLDPIRAILILIAQISGACFAAYLVSVIFPSPFNVQTTLGAGTTVAQGVWIEALCTALLVFTIIMLAKEKHRATFIAPIGIGLALFIAELVAVYYTGGSLNPARSFSPAAVAHNFTRNHWIYWVGPFVGLILAVLFYQLMKILEYEMANPGQDGDAENDPTQNPEHEVAQNVEEREVEVEEIQEIEEDGNVEGTTNSFQGVSANGKATTNHRGSDKDGERSARENGVKGGQPDLEAQRPIPSNRCRPIFYDLH